MIAVSKEIMGIEPVERIVQPAGIHVREFRISPGDNYFAHHGKPAGQNEIIEAATEFYV